VWLPGNLLMNYLDYHGQGAEDPLATVRLKMITEGAFGPIYVAGTIYVLWKRKTGAWATYREALAAGFHHWGRLFGTRFITGWLILVGLVALLVPGIIQFAKYALIDQVVVLEGTSGSHALSRSAELTRGKRWGVLAAWFLFLLIVFPVSIAGSFLLEQLGPYNNMWTSAAIDCFLDIISSFIVIVMFLFYWESACGTEHQD
jgi:hypothetical protein